MRFTKNRKSAFLNELIITGNVSKAASAVGVNRVTVYRHKNAVDKNGDLKNKNFSDAWDEAVDIYIDALVEEAGRRALSGVEKPVGWYQGVAGGTVKDYSDNLLMFLIKAHRPEFREKIESKFVGDLTIIKQEPGYKGSQKTKTEKKA